MSGYAFIYTNSKLKKTLMDSEVVFLWFSKSCVSAAKIEWFFKFQLILLSFLLFFFLIYWYD
jgi:hypothetical protein